MKPEKAMQIKYILTIYLYYNKVIINFAKISNLIYSNKVLEESIDLNFKKKNYTN